MGKKMRLDKGEKEWVVFFYDVYHPPFSCYICLLLFYDLWAPVKASILQMFQLSLWK